MSEHKLKIGIAQGDPNGIGWETIVKALSDTRMTELCTPVIYGSAKAADYYRKTVAEAEEFQPHSIASAAEARQGKVCMVVCGEVDEVTPGKATPQAGRAAVEALRRAVEELKAGNSEFKKAAEQTMAALRDMGMEELEYFTENFLPAFSLTLDELQ